ncbi:MAG: rod shape-determining protein MreC [Phocaeicola sp.]
MKHLLHFLLKYNYFLLFLLLEGISLFLLFRFNRYQGSTFFTSSNYMVGRLYEWGNGVTRYFYLQSLNDDLVQRNVELEIQVDRLSKTLNDMTADTTTIEQIKQESLTDYSMWKAHVINNSVTRSQNYITINKGELDGIRQEMGVLSGSGIVGIVYLTSDHYSLVLSVLNTKSSISCKIKGSDYFGFLKWDGGSSQYAFVKDLPRHAIFSLGDTIVTSGHSAVFPPGIPIGTVYEMSDSNDGLSYLLQVKLFSDFARLNDVRVISTKKREEQVTLENAVITPQR